MRRAFAGSAFPLEEDNMQIWGYRLVNGAVEAQIFTDALPKGWVDTPAKCKPKGVKNANGK